jgi:uncharacterized protein (TIGR02646 family)
MRHIDKTNEKSLAAADVLHRWRDSYTNAKGEKFSEICKKEEIKAETLWEYLTDKEALRKNLSKEQGGICCYCCRRIIEKSIIEHFESKSDNKCENTYSYGNLLLSCNGDAAELKTHNVVSGETWESIARNKNIEVNDLKKKNTDKKHRQLFPKDKINLPHAPNPEHCDAIKGDKTTKIINPTTDKECADKFIYTSEGVIKEADENDNLAKETISLLNLNASLLKKARIVAWKEAQQTIADAIADTIDLTHLKEEYEQPFHFCVVYRYYLKSQFGL